jgi:glycine/D-amino acid oxidase-like deaminating enzyme/nitrite reductase/ring-hydroxylating ferredoxin subunit
MSDGSTPLPTETTPLWFSTTPRTSYPPLDGDRTAEVVVVGGGIAGLSAALELAEAGRETLLVEKDRIVEGTTGHTTAKVTSLHGLVYQRLRRTLGTDAARRYGEVNQAAVETVAERAAASDVDCDFRRLSAYTYAPSDEHREDVRTEARTADTLGLPAAFVESTSLPYSTAGAVEFAEQAQFDPRKYCLALADRFEAAGGEIYERTTVSGLDGGDPCRVETDRGAVTAERIVVTTHFPLKDRAGFFARMRPKHSYLLALRPADESEVPDGMFYDPSEPYRSVRPYERDGEQYVLVGGENHKTGQADAAERYERLAAFACERFDVASIDYRWSTQDYVTHDRVPYVGPMGPTTDGVFVATGFGGWGMTNGTVAGGLLAALVAGRDHPARDLYSPRRIATALSPLRDLVAENVDNAARFATGRFDAERREAIEHLDAGEGVVLRSGVRPLAVSRDESGELHVMSAVCPHMNCIVDWNAAENSWDCPCHGSRFDSDGRVLDGPATEPLADRRPPEE